MEEGGGMEREERGMEEGGWRDGERSMRERVGVGRRGDKREK